MTVLPRHQPTDVPVAKKRTTFAALLNAYFDRRGWWHDQEKPWRRLSLMVSNSPQNCERWLAGSMPSRAHVAELAQCLALPERTLQYVLDHNALPPADELARTPVRVQLTQVLNALPDADLALLLPLAERLRDLGGRR